MAESRTLVKKLAEIMAEIDHVEKRGRNDFHKYNYVKAADLTHIVRDKLAARHIMFIPDTEETRQFVIPAAKVDKSDNQAILLTVRYTFYDGESGESISFRVPGCGADAGDKGVYKALTGSLKYALREAFLIPDESDPENEQSGSNEVPRYVVMTNAFKNVGVSITQLEKRLKHTIDKTSDEEFEELEGVYRQIKAGKPAGEFFVAQTAVTASHTDNPNTSAPRPVPATVAPPPVNHEPAKAGNEPRPGEKKGRGRPASKKEKPPTEPAPVVPANPPPDGIPVEDPPDDPSATKTEEAPATAEEKKAIYPKLKGYSAVAGLDPLKSYVMKTNNVSDTSKLTKKQWDVTIAALEAAHKEGPEALKKLVNG